MARKRGRPAKSTTPKRSPKTLLHSGNRTSLIVGSIIVLAIVLVAAGLSYKYIKHRIPTFAPTKQTSSTSITPTPSVSATVSASVSPTTNPTATQSPTPSNAQNQLANGSPVKKLPFTGGTDITYTVRENDSLAAIGEKFCNDNRAWIYLEQKNDLNENSTLHPGDTVKIACQ